MRSVALIALGIIAVGVALFLALYSDDDPVVEKPQPTVSEPAQATTKAPAASQPEKQEPEKAANVPPSFDVVRINPEGDAVIAGRATPEAKVSVLVDGETVLGEAKADKRGEWVYLPSTPLEPGERELGLEALNPDGSIMRSKDVVVLSVPDNKERALAVAMSRDGGEGASVLQAPEGEALALSIDAVNYDEKGTLTLSGTAPENGTVFLYLDNDFLGEAEADENGKWSLSPQKSVAPGKYQLRADHVDENRKVLNRVSIPFARAENLVDVPDDRKIVVQPGNSLWRIARRLYGTGFDYAVIYAANKEQITDPDLIYPGQVFEIPTKK